MTVAASVVRWAVVVVVVAALAGVSSAQGIGGSVVDISHCKSGCSAVPEDLWPSCCEAHNTCCEEFADSCMHDCLPRVHSGDVSAVEERPGMCCALYNLCCFRETFRISSGKSHSQEPVSFPIVHRFHVPPPTLQEALNPTARPTAPRPTPRSSFTAPKQSTGDQQQEAATAPKRPSFNRPQVSKKPFRPQRPQSFKKPQSTGEEQPASEFSSQGSDGPEKPKIRPKFGFLANRKDPEERRKEAEERRKLGPQGPSVAELAVRPKVTRRPATADIRQEVVTPQVLEAEPQGSRRLDASINPVVTRKRMKVTSETRQAARGETRDEEQEPRGVRVRKLEVTPTREGRVLTSSRSSSRPSGQTSQVQSVVLAGQEESRPTTRRPSPTPPTPAFDDTPKVSVEEQLIATIAAAAKITEPMQDETPMTEEASSPVEVVISAQEMVQETEKAEPEQPSEAVEDQVSEPNRQETKEELQPSPEAAEKEGKPEMMKEEKSEAETPEKTAFTPPEITVNIPTEIKDTDTEAVADQDTVDALVEPLKTRGDSSRSRATRTETTSTQATTQSTRSKSLRSSRRRGSSRTTSRPEMEQVTPSTRRRSRVRS